MNRTRRLVSTSLLALVLASVSVVAVQAPASAAPPVVVADAVEGYAGAIVEVQPLANDSDPDGDELEVCRVADSPYKKIEVFDSGGSVLMLVSPRTKPGTYTFTYYACDFESLVPGTITLTVLKAPKITAKALPGKPGMIKVTNPANFRIIFMYGSFREGGPDGTVKVSRNSSVTLRVRRTRIDWIAFSPRNGYSTMGHIRDIKLPPGTTPPRAEVPLPARLAKLWNA